MTIRTVIAAATLACLACVPVGAAVVDAPTTTAGPVAAVITTDTTVCSVPTVDNGMCRSGGRFTAGSRVTAGRVSVSPKPRHLCQVLPVANHAAGWMAHGFPVQTGVDNLCRY